MSTTELHVSSRAYAKMILHAAKYPHLAVNGVLLAKQGTSAKGGAGRLEIVDAIPLFHQCLYVTPMAEVALTQIEAFAEAEGLQISGYYAASENFDENSVERAPGLKIADKIVEISPNACLLMIDNKGLGLIMDRAPVNAWHAGHGSAVQPSERRNWQRIETVNIERLVNTLDAVSALLQKSAARDLQDFDNYLDNVQNDWRNAQLNRDLPQLLAMY